MALGKNLYFVSQLMGADLSCFEEVDLLDILANMELPHSINLLSEAVHGLISTRCPKEHRQNKFIDHYYNIK
jgi:hypothetical protein